MTFNKIVYVGCKELQSLNTVLEDLSDQLTEHVDGAGENEIWIEIDNDFALDILSDHGFITNDEKTEIIKNGADTILFY
jgi:hypothetical protein